MPWKNLSALIVSLIVWSSPTQAGQMSTYLQGTIIKKTAAYWVLQTSAGTYWIDVNHPPSFTKKISDLELGFWVQMRNIKRYRPNMESAFVDFDSVD